ncbi:MAG: class I SAM-dependent methyltransferase [Pseudomonadota bacterium]
MTGDTEPLSDVFKDPEHAAQYADTPAKFMPGFADLHRMVGVLIRETAPPDAHVLVHGAGVGLELDAFARENRRWTFVGVDPAKPMLDEAKNRLGDLNERITLHHGYADDAPAGPFDAATSLLTLHFLNAGERRTAIAEIVQRLKPGSPFVVAHCSFPQDLDNRVAWLERHRAFTVSSGVDAELAEKGRKNVSEDLEVFDPQIDEEILREAGLSKVTMFYAAFTWRGWVGWVP